MAKPITTTTGTGTVASVSDTTDPRYAALIGATYNITVTLDNGGATLMETTRTAPTVKAGDKVSFSITDGPMGQLMTGVTKTS
ncbi:hypothetical protein [Pseudomonas sp. TWP3-2]|uniref:hypothetical protein n=1 Tax=Pseudomonas sp. TWP3-2 TaxID=2804574 RepID=UPI003CF6E04D